MTDLTLPVRLDPASLPDETLHVTASGLPVRIYSINGGGKYPIHGAVYTHDEWELRSWLDGGKYQMSGEGHDLDLRDRPKAKRSVWVAWFESPNGFRYLRPYATEHEALYDPQDDGALISLTYLKEGDGLDTPADPPLVVDWAKLPEWAKWAAADEDGEVWGYDKKPTEGNNTWCAEDHCKCAEMESPLYRLAPGFDWRETLIQRPEGK